jgi:hypothetical protein
MASVNTKLLLGWMEEVEAMTWLLQECKNEQPFSEQSARDLWNQYRNRVAALMPRKCPTPAALAERTTKEEYAEHHFTQKHAKNRNVLRVVKLDDPSKLIVHQLSVVIPQSDKYLDAMRDPKQRAHTCLGRGLTFEGVHPKARRDGTRLIKAAPHAEFSVGGIQQEDFQLIENNRHIAVKEFDGRMLLWAGYHRAHISMYRNRPEDTVLPLFAAVESDADGFFSTNSVAGFKRDMVRGSCPPLLGDFFDDSLCIQLPLRKCRVEMFVDLNTHVWGRLWVDDES